MTPRWLARRRLKDPDYAFLFEPGPADEVVCIDCETTGLDRRKDEIVSVAAVRIRGATVLTSEAFYATVRGATAINPEAIKLHGLRERDVTLGRAMADVLPRFLRFLGGRPLVGYFLEFDVAMLDRYVRAWLGIGLPNRKVEVSGLYYDRKYADAPPGMHVDLSYAALAADLRLDLIDQHDALADATMTAVMYMMLKDMQTRRVRIPRSPYTAVAGFTGG